MRWYSTQFDLMKDVRVRVYTLLSGPCTGGKMIKSTNYTELVRKSANTGTSQRPPGKAVQREIQSIIRKRNVLVLFCLSKSRRCKHSGPRLCLRELWHGEGGMHLAKRHKDSGQGSAAPVFLVPHTFESFSFIWCQHHKNTENNHKMKL